MKVDTVGPLPGVGHIPSKADPSSTGSTPSPSRPGTYGAIESTSRSALPQTADPPSRLLGAESSRVLANESTRSISAVQERSARTLPGSESTASVEMAPQRCEDAPARFALTHGPGLAQSFAQP